MSEPYDALSFLVTALVEAEYLVGKIHSGSETNNQDTNYPYGKIFEVGESISEILSTQSDGTNAVAQETQDIQISIWDSTRIKTSTVLNEIRDILTKYKNTSATNPTLIKIEYQGRSVDNDLSLPKIYHGILQFKVTTQHL